MYNLFIVDRYTIHVLCFVHYFLPLVLDIIISLLLLPCQDLLKRAWGWEMLLPRLNGSIDWDQYKTYLEEYYQHNADKAASKETLRAAANLARSPCFANKTLACPTFPVAD